MAESADFNNSAQYVNFNVTNLDRDAFIFHKYILGIPSLKDHHEQLCANLFQSVVSDTNHKIHNLLPDRNQPCYNSR